MASTTSELPIRFSGGWSPGWNGENPASGLTSDTTRSRALRVPSVIPNRWVYLRCWLDCGTFVERTWNDSVRAILADCRSGLVSVNGLPLFTSREPTLLFNVRAVDDWFISLGAEVVELGKWPLNCVGNGHRVDRIPYGYPQGDIDYDGRIVKDDDDAFRAWVKVNEPGRYVP